MIAFSFPAPSKHRSGSCGLRRSPTFTLLGKITCYYPYTSPFPFYVRECDPILLSLCLCLCIFFWSLADFFLLCRPSDLSTSLSIRAIFSTGLSILPLTALFRTRSPSVLHFGYLGTVSRDLSPPFLLPSPRCLSVSFSFPACHCFEKRPRCRVMPPPCSLLSREMMVFPPLSLFGDR